SVILDVGGHVGFATLFFAQYFPAAQVVVLEPDRERAAQIREHLHANGLTRRVEVVQAAAAARNGRARLSAGGSSSKIGEQGEEVELRDLLELLAGRRADIVKMDIEGSEYEILAD